MTTEEYLVARCVELEAATAELEQAIRLLEGKQAATEILLKQEHDKYEKLKAAIRPTLFPGRKYIEIKTIWDDEEAFTEMLQQFPELQEEEQTNE